MDVPIRHTAMRKLRANQEWSASYTLLWNLRYKRQYRSNRIQIHISFYHLSQIDYMTRQFEIQAFLFFRDLWFLMTWRLIGARVAEFATPIYFMCH